MLDLFARVVLAAVFLAAVAGKVRTRQGFAEFRDSIAALAPWLPARPLALVVLTGEALAVVLLAIPGTSLGYALAVALLAAFCGGIVLAIRSAKSVRCKCFGAGGDVLGPKHLVRNAALIAVALVGAFVTPPASWEEPMTLLTIAVVLLAVVVAVHVLFTFGLVARVRELQERSGPPRNQNLPQPGTVIPSFSVTDTDGMSFTEADLDGPVQVGFFSVGCGPCRSLTDALLADPPAARFVSVVDGDPTDPEATARLVEKVSALGRVAVIGADDPVLSAFGVMAYPTLLHTHGGVVTASGIKLSDFAGVPAPVA
ncbi:TlpA family protein disulfide reductase [Lentzea nigeriaca]|uniref:TlpA family protein disulfide reductase n=1 Tax=Lentzea nigeriaca TaxID=1128665 RepID=UPI00195B9D3E|nr:MauE/DoxX family redox-associated membrane protein [Lentzea nigeriaca]MBM7856533.1 thiol-disulfide isomerase/thioredoxin [Lentzea nigeriaca]